MVPHSYAVENPRAVARKCARSESIKARNLRQEIKIPQKNLLVKASNTSVTSFAVLGSKRLLNLFKHKLISTVW